MKVLKENILNVIPQRPPFVMIDNLIEATIEGFESDFVPETNNIFIKAGILQESALVENIAQTCAAGFGYLDKQPGGKPKLGFIGAVSKLELFNLPKATEKIFTKVKIAYQFENVFLVKGENFAGDKKLLECEMKIVVSEEA